MNTLTYTANDLSLFRSALVEQNLETVPVVSPSLVEERNKYILESLRQATPMLRNMARHYDLDFDELYQTAAEIALRWYDYAIGSPNPRAYLHKAIRRSCLNMTGVTNPHRKHKLSDFYQIVSLDIPLFNGKSILRDLIPELPQVMVDTRGFTSVYAAIDTLPTIYHEVIVLRFGLFGYAPHSMKEIAERTGRPFQTAQSQYYRAIHRLCDALQEVQA